jgi:hypothetical protein
MGNKASAANGGAGVPDASGLGSSSMLDLSQLRSGPGSQQPQQQTRVALLVGNAAYSDSKIPTLRNPVKDVRALAQLLQMQLGFQVTVHTDVKTRDDFVR